MNHEKQDIFFKKYLDALNAYFPDIILSAVIHRDEVFHPIDDELKELYPEGKMTPHMHVTIIPIVRDRKTDIKKISISELWKGKNISRPLATVTFNRRIKKCCMKLSIVYRSSHKIRFSTASILHKNGTTDTELQQQLGHTTLTMTNGYLKNITPRSETYNKINHILD